MLVYFVLFWVVFVARGLGRNEGFLELGIRFFVFILVIKLVRLGRGWN